MRQRPRSENRGIVRKLCDTGEASANIGSRVFPFRSPPASMPSVGARRSTRVFVPKASAAAAKPPPRDAKLHRASKPVATPRNRADGDVSDWLPLAWWKPEEGKKRGSSAGAGGGGRGVGSGLRAVPPEPVLGVQMFDRVYRRKPAVRKPRDPSKDKMYDIVYGRKRRLAQSDVSGSSSSSRNLRYGIVYTRTQPRKKQKVEVLVEPVAGEARLETKEVREHVDAAPGAEEALIETRVEDRVHEDAVPIADDALVDTWAEDRQHVDAVPSAEEALFETRVEDMEHADAVPVAAEAPMEPGVRDREDAVSTSIAVERPLEVGVGVTEYGHAATLAEEASMETMVPDTKHEDAAHIAEEASMETMVRDKENEDATPVAEEAPLEVENRDHEDAVSVAEQVHSRIGPEDREHEDAVPITEAVPMETGVEDKDHEDASHISEEAPMETEAEGSGHEDAVPKDTLMEKLVEDREHEDEASPMETSVEVMEQVDEAAPVGTLLEVREQEGEMTPMDTLVEVRDHEDSPERLNILRSARNFAEKVVGISEGDVCTAPDDRLTLAVLVDPSCSGATFLFSTILISVVSWMRRPRVGLWSLVSILFSESLADFLSLHGIHFLPFHLLRIDVLTRNALPSCGLCKIYNVGHFVPLFSVNFFTLPIYFRNLHVALALESVYLPGVLTRYLMDVSRYGEECYALVPAKNVDVTLSLIPIAASSELTNVTEAPELVLQNMVIKHNSNLQKLNKRKRKTRPRVDQNIIVSLPAGLSSLHNVVEPIHVKPVDACLGDMMRDEDDTSSPCGLLKSKKIEGTKEMKLALTEVKQNIDSVTCNANILVTASDRCWREEGAELLLEFSDSKEWCISVKVQGTTRYLHKPQEWRPCAVNRLNHTYMWGWEDGWKLEFFDKWDWSVFKELHMECRERNTPEVPVKIIPVPGVQEVSGYDEIVTSSFMRPDTYIHMMGDEVERAVASKIASYDMDSGDEEWLKQQIPGPLHSEDNILRHISEDDFEKIIFALEKDAYSNPNDLPDKDRALDLCRDLERRDTMAVVYDYWLKKRNKRRTSLVKVFQSPLLRRPQLLQKPCLRKKRSFSRQRSQVGRGKPDFYLQTGAKLEAKRRVQEAENAANKAVEAAIRQRSRAQMFMMNAELVAYKSTMALRIAEAKRVSDSSDLASVILD